MVSDTFDSPVFEIEELLDAGEHVVVIGVLRGQGQSSGIAVERRQGYVWTVRDGRAVRFAWFNDPTDALAAAGLDQDDG
jgi:ketosteroid isomerase-like protein